MTETFARSRGLDTLRALAILLVFCYHYKVFVSREDSFGLLSVIGWVGVDLFFVLSGFLIANGLFTGLARGQRLQLRWFFVRRALRTWPVFWVVLAAYFLWPIDMGGKTPPPLWAFLSFTQNHGLKPGTAFSHAWSLCIEEQFYLVLPLVLTAGVAFGARLRHGWLLMAALWALGIGARAVLWMRFGRADFGEQALYHPWLYYATLCRFDEFLPGIAVAMIKHFHTPLWRKLMARGRMVFWVGVGATALAMYGVVEWYVIGDDYGAFMTIAGYSLIACAFAVLVVAALSPHTGLYNWQIPGAGALAAWSYAIYLSHKALAHVLQTRLSGMGYTVASHPWFLVVAVSLGSVLVGYLLYLCIERPIMRWRDTHTPPVFA